MYRAPFSRSEIGFIRSYILMNGHMTYKDAERAKTEYFKATGCNRISASIYMAAWRYERGFYDHLC